MNPDSGHTLLYLFVYGTLRRGAATKWSRFLADRSSFTGFGRTRGVLFQLDGYPGMIAAGHEEAWVRGEICLLDTPSLLAALDEYEGDEFERQQVAVELDDGRTVQAWAYLYRGETEGRASIVSGDYLRFFPP